MPHGTLFWCEYFPVWLFSLPQCLSVTILSSGKRLWLVFKYKDTRCCANAKAEYLLFHMYKNELSSKGESQVVVHCYSWFKEPRELICLVLENRGSRCPWEWCSNHPAPPFLSFHSISEKYVTLLCMVNSTLLVKGHMSLVNKLYCLDFK